jgi:hypothetical protein
MAPAVEGIIKRGGLKLSDFDRLAFIRVARRLSLHLNAFDARRMDLT